MLNPKLDYTLVCFSIAPRMKLKSTNFCLLCMVTNGKRHAKGFYSPQLKENQKRSSACSYLTQTFVVQLSAFRQIVGYDVNEYHAQEKKRAHTSSSRNITQQLTTTQLTTMSFFQRVKEYQPTASCIISNEKSVQFWLVQNETMINLHGYNSISLSIIDFGVYDSISPLYKAFK